MRQKNFLFRLPEDVWLVDLDSGKLVPSMKYEEVPKFSEPECGILRNHLKQVNIEHRMIFQHLMKLDLIPRWKNIIFFRSSTKSKCLAKFYFESFFFLRLVRWYFSLLWNYLAVLGGLRLNTINFLLMLNSLLIKK